LSCSGRSKFDACAAFAIGASSASFINEIIRSASRGGVISSRSPTTTSVGTFALRSVSAESGRAAIAFSAAMTPSGDDSSMILRTASRV